MEGINTSEVVGGWAVYLRTSTSAPYGNIEAQRIIVQRELLDHSSLPIVKEYVGDANAKAEDEDPTENEALSRLLADARQGKFSHVAAASPDRLARDADLYEHILTELKDLGVTVQTASTDGTPVALF